MDPEETATATSPPGVTGHPTVAERRAAGREARKQAPRSSHATFAPAPGRPHPVDRLESQAATRVPELVPIRYGRMLSSAFAFFRGAALVMASDLAQTPRSGLTAQLCGDAHLSNFGVFGSPERREVFDLNDFDETLPGPWEWDVKRLAASVEVAARDNRFAAAERRDAVRGAVTAYREWMGRLAAMRDLDVWYFSVDAATILDDLRSGASRRAAQAPSGRSRGRACTTASTPTRS